MEPTDGDEQRVISSIYVSLICGPDSSSPSYESQSYQNDMDKAQRLLREEKWNKAIAAYREIIRKAPKKGEPRFSLARIYQKMGHFGLALSEYQKIVDLKNELGRNHVYVLESERSIKELKENYLIRHQSIMKRIKPCDKGPISSGGRK
ncbi:MAG: hypothetical protein QME90_02060 [Thermodesulfobacteriota bacterium]|nr:hypothetical protein [Thermodesulfobacteriota bacterium]